ncbi:hypothetical protein [Elioraea sp.]|uniref:hypothetical protein n=1 Tax=Elioraea sp. TaxID=2185103 RepID=UPI003F6F57E6
MASADSGRATVPAAELRAFAAASPDDEVTTLLAYALAMREAERRGAMQGESPSLEAVQRHRHEAEAMLAVWSHRYLHNRMEELRLEGVRQHLARLPRPLGFLRLTLACAFGTSAVGALGIWLTGHGDVLADAAARALATLRAMIGG